MEILEPSACTTGVQMPLCKLCALISGQLRREKKNACLTWQSTIMLPYSLPKKRRAPRHAFAQGEVSSRTLSEGPVQSSAFHPAKLSIHPAASASLLVASEREGRHRIARIEAARRQNQLTGRVIKERAGGPDGEPRQSSTFALSSPKQSVSVDCQFMVINLLILKLRNTGFTCSNSPTQPFIPVST